MTLTNRAKECGGREPGWLTSIPRAQRDNPLSRTGQQAKMAERYLDQQKTPYVHLADGGVADNLALRGAGGLMQTATIREIGARGFIGIRRILVLSVDGQGTQDTSLAQHKYVGGLLSLVLRASGAQIDRYNFETLIAVGEQVQGLAKLIAEARCEKGPVINGTPCGDVKGALIHVSLAEMPPSPEKAKLLAIPTGLTIKREDVDLLTKAGEQAITASAPVQAFLADFPPGPPLPPAPPPRRARGHVSAQR